MKLCPPEMTAIILRLFNSCLATGTFPKAWKEAVTIPLPKSNTASSPSDFRPISLLSCLGKTMERMMSNRLHFFLEKTSFFNPAQFGFRRKKGAEQQLANVIQHIHDSFHRGDDVLMVSLDIKKAFDTVWRPGIISKLHDNAQVRGPILRLTADYLRDRYARVSVGDATSQPAEWVLGVPQGGVLSPLLFNVFINDVLEHIPAEVEAYMFADDIAIATPISRIDAEERKKGEELMQKALEAINTWFGKWRLQPSPAKTQVLVMVKPRPRKLDPEASPIELKLNNHPIKQNTTGTLKYLGMTFDEKLSWNPHVADVGRRVEARLRVLAMLSGCEWGADTGSMKLIYVSWIRPIIEYGTGALCMASHTLMQTLEKKQNKALRYILRAPLSASTHAMAVEARIPHLAARRIEILARTASKLLRLNEENVLARKFQQHHHGNLNNQTHTHDREADPDDWLRGSHALAGPMAVMKIALNMSGLQGYMQHNEHTQHFPRIPWLLPMISTHPDDIEKEWPCLGSAGARSDEQQEQARIFGKKQIQDATDSVPEGSTALVIVSDGSADPRDDLKPSGCAICIKRIVKEQNNNVSEKEDSNRQTLGRLTTNGGAELQGILLGLQHAMENTDASTVFLFCDSQICVRMARSGQPGKMGNYWKIIQKINHAKQALRARGSRIVVDWVPGHAGVEMNEVADEEAKAAADQNTPKDPIVALPLTVALRVIRRTLLARWNEWWETGGSEKHGRKLAEVHQSVKQNPPVEFTRLKVRTQACITRLRLGCATTNHILHIVGKSDSIECSYCPTTDTADHRMFFCQHYRSQRATLEGQLVDLTGSGTLNRQRLLGLQLDLVEHREEIANMLETFLTSTNLINLFVWNKTVHYAHT